MFSVCLLFDIHFECDCVICISHRMCFRHVFKMVFCCGTPFKIIFKDFFFLLNSNELLFSFGIYYEPILFKLLWENGKHFFFKVVENGIIVTMWIEK